MSRELRYLAQAVVYALTAAVLGYFADSPAYTHLPPDRALIRMSFAHGGERKEPCRRLSSEEIAKLAPNMRRAVVCSRERIPIYVELVLDDRVLFQRSMPPTGLSDDGPSRVYERFVVTPGRHRLVVRMRDTKRSEGFDYERRAEIDLRPGQNFAIAFKAETGGFVFM